MVHSSNSDTLHPCGIPGCRMHVSAAYFMCCPHWRAVPQKLAREVSRAAYAHEYSPQRFHEHTKRRLLAALDAAIASVTPDTAEPSDDERVALDLTITPSTTPSGKDFA